MSPRCLDVSTIASGHVYHDCSLAVAAVLPGVWSCPPWCLVSGRVHRGAGTCLLERRITATTTNVQGHYITIVCVPWRVLQYICLQPVFSRMKYLVSPRWCLVVSTAMSGRVGRISTTTTTIFQGHYIHKIVYT